MFYLKVKLKHGERQRGQPASVCVGGSWFRPGICISGRQLAQEPCLRMIHWKVWGDGRSCLPVAEGPSACLEGLEKTSEEGPCVSVCGRQVVCKTEEERRGAV